MIKLETRFFQVDDDYEDIKVWWESRDMWNAIPPQLLPKTGIVVFDEETDRKLCAGWLYLDNSCPMSMLEWIVTNPSNKPRESYKSVKALVSCADMIRKAMGYTFMMTTSNNKGLIKLLEKCKFNITDGNVTHLVKED